MIDTLLLVMSAVSAFMGFVHLIIKVKRTLHYFAATTYLAQAAALCAVALARSGSSASTPFRYADIAALLVLAPSLYLSGNTLLEEGKRFRLLHALHYAAPLAASLLLAAASPGRSGSAALPDPREDPLAAYLGVASCLAVVGYVVGALIHGLPALRLVEGRARGERKVFLAFGLGLLPPAVFLAAARIAGDERVYAMALIALSAGTLTFAFVRVRNPSVMAFGLQDKPAGRRRAGADPRRTQELEARVRRLMEEERLYARQDLTVESLADILGSPAGAVSALFNAALNTNFRAFVNEYRLRQVMRDLVDKPDDSILDIAFDNGFNSKTSFNTLFSQAAGCSPREYRKRNAGKG